MLRIRGDRLSLLSALVAHWAEHQLLLPQAGQREPLTPAPPPRREGRGPAR